MRSVLGTRTRRLLETYCEQATFFVPATALFEAEEHLAALAAQRGSEPEVALKLLRALAALTEVLQEDAYEAYRHEAVDLIGKRDPDDWPVLACALATGCPIWCEDDFFGCGVAVWTSDRVERYLLR
ncbi:MAG TPA: nucleotide-binding protein [Solibacterales bacterium]|nr:nucleotide-binding protein [Bryobacterales bacterium]